MLLPKYKHLRLGNKCNLRCASCELWDSAENIAQTPEDLLKEVGRNWLVNVCGGDPLLNSTLPHILRILRKQGHFTLLTTNGLRLPEIDPQLLSLIDLPVIFLPAFSGEDLADLTGFNCLAQYFNTLDFLNECKKKHILHFPVTPLNLEQLPLIWDYLEKHKRTHLCISYSRNSENLLKPSSEAYIRYYQERPRVFTYLTTEKAGQYCAGCIPGLEKVSLKNYLFFIKSFYKLYI
jgi:molybdenum cofactor biosynthesis enzyme MoaA